MPRKPAVETLSNASLRALVSHALNQHDVPKTKQALRKAAIISLRARAALHELYRRAELAAFVVNSFKQG
jgi:hypothetical protein